MGDDSGGVAWLTNGRLVVVKTQSVKMKNKFEAPKIKLTNRQVEQQTKKCYIDFMKTLLKCYPSVTQMIL